MSALLSADVLNDFISPGVACIKPIETLSSKNGDDSSNPYEVTTEERVAAANPIPAQISLTDCLACSGCVTSAEAVLVTLQSHTEVSSTLDAHPSLPPPWMTPSLANGWSDNHPKNGKIFVASVSPQARASLAATFGVSSTAAGNMISQLLSGPSGLATGGEHGSSFLWTLDTNVFRSAALVLAAEEVSELLTDPTRMPLGDGSSMDSKPKKPILTSACPGWICYVEKTHPHILPHLSRLKSPQALAGTLLKSVLSRKFGVHPSSVWHLAIMPCFDKKLEASRSELTSTLWDSDQASASVRDVDCVITARELISLASSRGINFAQLPRTALPRQSRVVFPDPSLDTFLFPPIKRKIASNSDPTAGTSDGYLWHIIRRLRAQNPGSTIKVERGRNADIVEYILLGTNHAGQQVTLAKFARYYGFRNIQNLVRRLKPAKKSRLLLAAAAAAGTRGNVNGGSSRKPGNSEVSRASQFDPAGSAAPTHNDYAYVEAMACPGGCTNGGGQIRAAEVAQLGGEDVQEPNAAAAVAKKKTGPQQQREWLARVDEAYFSCESEDSSDETDADTTAIDPMDMDEDTSDMVDCISRNYILGVLHHWAEITRLDKDCLVLTSYRRVESDVGKAKKQNDVERVAGLASSIGGGW